MNKSIALLLAFVFAGPLLWYNFRDYFADVDRRRSSTDGLDGEEYEPGFIERRLDRWFEILKFAWRVVVPLLVFGLIYGTLSSVNW